MGTDKALLQLQDQTLLNRAVQVLAETLTQTPDQIWVSGDRPGYLCIHDRVPGLGPLGAIDSILNANEFASQPSSAFLIMPVDMPGCTPELLSVLAHQAQQCDTPAIHFRDKEMPLLIRSTGFTRKILNDCLGNSDRSQRSVRAFLKQIQALEIEIPKQLIHEFKNINTPSEWSAYENTNFN